MRRGLLIVVTGLVLLAGGIMVLKSRQLREPAPGVPETASAESAGEPAAVEPVAAAQPVHKAVSDTVSTDAAPATSAEQKQAAIEARIAQLEDLAGEETASALEVLLSELKNPEQQIRHAALEAITQMGNRDAIPRLLELAAQTDQPEEKKAIVEAADFLKLPTLTETLRKARKP